MAISARRRKSLPSSAFAYPSRRAYPIDTLARARNALARAAQPGTSGSYAHVAKAVRKKWGNRVATVGRKRGTVSSSGYRKGSGSSSSSGRRKRARASTSRSIRGRKR